jgi:hypothetical protein
LQGLKVNHGDLQCERQKTHGQQQRVGSYADAE